MFLESHVTSWIVDDVNIMICTQLKGYLRGDDNDNDSGGGGGGGDV